MFEMDGGRGISIGHYTQDGIPELLMNWYHKIEEYYDTYYVVSIWLELYENGKVVKSTEFNCYYDIETDEHITEFENEEAQEGVKLLDEMLAILGEGKDITIESEEYKDKIEAVLLEELLNP